MTLAINADVINCYLIFITNVEKMSQSIHMKEIIKLEATGYLISNGTTTVIMKGTPPMYQ